MIFLAATHIAMLCGIATLGALHYRGDGALRWNVAFLLVWFSLESTGYLIGFAGLLDNLVAYIATTIVFALLGFLFLRRFGAWAAPSINAPPDDPNDTFERRLVLVCKCLAALAILCTLIIALSYYPNNPDSVAYRFARVMLYLGQGNIHHPAATDPRLSFYPLNGVFFYFPAAVCGLDQRIFTLASVACWLIGASTVYALAEELGASRNAALFAATLYLLAPAVLVSASSTNDDLLSGVPLAAGVLFFLRWLRGRNWADAVLAGIGFGTSFGVKLHFLFYLPLLAAFILAFFLNRQLRHSSIAIAREQPAQLCVIVALAFVFSFPALAINISETGIMLPPFPENMNRPFSYTSAGVNTVLYTAQLFLAPGADLLFGFSAEARKHAIDAYIAFFNTHFFSWVNPGLHYQAELPDGRILAEFKGVANPSAKLGVWEGIVWVGFLPWALLLTLYWSFRLRTQQSAYLAFWLTASLFLWHLGRCIFSKYVDGAGIYYAFAIVPAAPALAWLWQMRQTFGRPYPTLITLVMLFTLAGETGSAISSLGFSPERNVAEAIATTFSPRRNTVMSDDLRSCLSTSEKIHIGYTGWELRIFHLMSARMNARYSLSSSPPFDLSPLAVLVYPKQSQAGDIPVQIAGAQGHYLTLMGKLISENNAFAFVKGSTPACRNFAHSGFVVFLANPILRDSTGKVASLDIRTVVGYVPAWQFEAKLIEQTTDGKQKIISDWAMRRTLDGHFVLPVPANDGEVAIYVREVGWKGPVQPTLFSLKPDGDVTLPTSEK